MTSQQQYYQAKVFLKAYSDALKTLQQVTAQQAQFDKLKAYEKYLVNSSQIGAIQINNGALVKGKNFQNFYLRKLGQYSKYQFTKNLQGFQSVNNPQLLSNLFEKYINS